MECLVCIISEHPQNEISPMLETDNFLGLVFFTVVVPGIPT